MKIHTVKRQQGNNHKSNKKTDADDAKRIYSNPIICVLQCLKNSFVINMFETQFVVCPKVHILNEIFKTL